MTPLEFNVSLGPPNDKAAAAEKLAERLSVQPLGEGRYQVVFADGDTVIYDARRVARGAGYSTLSLRPQGIEGGAAPQVVVDVEGELPDLKVHLQSGEQVALKLVDTQSLAAAARTGGLGLSAQSKEIKSPMPGKTVKVLCAPGQAVKAGQGLVIIEAMKMENELRATGDGVVKEVRVAEGQNVEGAAVLVVLE